MALSHGIPVSQGALLLGYLSISAIFGKLLCGRLADLPRVRRLYIFVISATVLSVSSMCVTAARSYHGLLAYALVAGFFDGCFVVTVPLITQDIVGKELMAKALGIQYGLVAFPLTLGPPVLGETTCFRHIVITWSTLSNNRAMCYVFFFSLFQPDPRPHYSWNFSIHIIKN